MMVRLWPVASTTAMRRFGRSWGNSGHRADTANRSFLTHERHVVTRTHPRQNRDYSRPRPAGLLTLSRAAGSISPYLILLRTGAGHAWQWCCGAQVCAHLTSFNWVCFFSVRLDLFRQSADTRISTIAWTSGGGPRAVRSSIGVAQASHYYR
jgi:hypothetical protein